MSQTAKTVAKDISTPLSKLPRTPQVSPGVKKPQTPKAPRKAPQKTIKKPFILPPEMDDFDGAIKRLTFLKRNYAKMKKSLDEIAQEQREMDKLLKEATELLRVVLFDENEQELDF